jgi:phage/plasmid-associated DNA primase
MASGLSGHMLQNLFILTGSGSNGKDTLISRFYRSCMGHCYHLTGNVVVLTEPPKASGASVEVSELNKKRVVVYSEPCSKNQLQASSIKKFTGDKFVNARGLYSSDTKTVICATQFLLCNEIPNFNDVDGGVKRRLVVIPFNSKFMSQKDLNKIHEINENKTEEEKKKYEIENNLFLGDITYDSDKFRNEYKMSLFHLLIEYYYKYKVYNMSSIQNIPDSIEKLSMDVIKRSDNFNGWFDEQYTKTEDKKDVLSCSTIFVDYKLSELYNNYSKCQKRDFNKKFLIQQIIKNPATQNYYKERAQIKVNGKKTDKRDVLIGFKVKHTKNTDDMANIMD